MKNKTRRRPVSAAVSIIIAVMMMLSTVLVSGLPLGAFAATDAATIYLDVSGSSSWQNKTIVASFENSSDTVTFSAVDGKSNMLSASLPSGVNSSVMTLTAYDSSFPLDLVNASFSGYRIICRSVSSRNYIYAWTGSSNNAQWPGETMTSYSYNSTTYYYKDLSTKYQNCIFNGGSDSNKTGDLTVLYTANSAGTAAYYNGSEFETPMSCSIGLSLLESNQNLFVINSSGSVSASKYTYSGSGLDLSGVETKTVYLYSYNWLDSAYVTYDLSDVYSETVEMTKTENPNGVTYYSATVPSAAMISFSNGSASTISLGVPKDYEDPLYLIDSSSSHWTTLDNLPTSSDRIPTNNWTDTSGNPVYAVTATYFDYLSDTEISNGYLNRANSRTDYPFSKLDSALGYYAKENKMAVPIYFGNLYEWNDFSDSNSESGYMYNFKNIANNSGNLGQYWYAVQGLASNTLTGNKLYFPTESGGSVEQVLFNADWLTSQSKNGQSDNLAKVIYSYFPFTSETDSSGTTTYRFDSTGGGTRNSNGDLTGGNSSNSDNVYFTWDGTEPKYVNYGSGSSAYVIKDGSSSGNNEFGVSGTGYGIFPFNNTSSTRTQTVGGTETSVTVEKSDIIFVSDEYESVGSVYMYAWNDSGNDWYAPYYDSANKLYYFTKTQTGDKNGKTLSDMTGFILYKNEYDDSNNNKINGCEDKNLTDYYGKILYTNNINGDASTSNVPTSENVTTVTGGTTYTKTYYNEDSYSDYGFGIRLDMDFRVPKNGMLTEAEEVTVSSDEIVVLSSRNTLYVNAWDSNSTHYPNTSNNDEWYKSTSSEKQQDTSNYIHRITKSDLNYTGSSNLSFAFNSTAAWNNSQKQKDNMSWGKAYTVSLTASSNNITEYTSAIYTAGSPVTFNYSGDDDLWVYISDDSGNSELVLDLGGDHKFTTGYIDFSDMTATAEAVQLNYQTGSVETPAVPSNEVWVAATTSDNVLYDNLYLKTWNTVNENGDSVDIYAESIGTVDYKFSDGTSEKFFKFSASDLNNATEFGVYSQKNDDLSNTAGEVVYLSTSSYAGTAYYIKDVSETGSSVKYNLLTYSHTVSSSSHNAGDSVTTSFFGGQCLDPNKTYHMTVFYLERGLIESNFSVSFTMTPVTNDLTVDKTVVTTGINGGDDGAMAADVKKYDTFSYTLSSSEDNLDGCTYTYTDRDGKTSTSTGSRFELKDSESAEWNAELTTGSTVSVTEESTVTSGGNNNLTLSERYSTTYTVTDVGDGNKKISSGEATSTGNFTLSSENEDKIELAVSYVNTLTTGSLELKKEVKDKSGNTVEGSYDFTYNVTVDVTGSGSNYTNYPLEYTVAYSDSSSVTYTTQTGVITFPSSATVTIDGLPIGSMVKIVENVPSGYSCSNSSQTITINSSSGNTVTFTNTQSSGNGKITVNKTLDGKNYSGSQFSFTLTPISTATGDAVQNKTFTNVSNPTAITQNTVSKGKVEFEVSFSEIGYYRYSISESTLSSGLIGYSGDKSTYYVEIYVTENSTTKELGISSTDFYSDSNFSTKLSSTPTFKNTVQTASVNVKKIDSSSKAIEGATFALVRVSEDGSVDYDTLYNLVKNSSPAVVTSNQSTSSDGTASWSNLTIYQAGESLYDISSSNVVTGKNYPEGESVTQYYALIEYSAPSGYNVNKTVEIFSFPVKADSSDTLANGYTLNSEGYVVDSNESYVYSATVEYIDYGIATPSASGSGVRNILIAGISIILTGAILAAAYAIYDTRSRRKRKERVAAHRNSKLE